MRHPVKAAVNLVTRVMGNNEQLVLLFVESFRVMYFCLQCFNYT